MIVFNQPTMTDIVICSLPILFPDRLPPAPGLLKAAVESAGYKAHAIDLNMEYFKQTNRDFIEFNKQACAFRANEEATPESVLIRDQWIANSIRLFKEINAPIIGISVFTIFQQRAAYHLSRAIREQLPNVVIIMGGYGLQMSANALEHEPSVRKIDLLKTFHQFAIEKNLTNHAVIGAGLDDLIAIMEKELGPRSSDKVVWDGEKALYAAPVPNYDDYELDKYIWNDNTPALPVTGSRGCVRACTFCDIPGQFGRFKYRTGEDIAKEMIELRRQYGIRIFEFTDSLVNGSLKAFNQLLVELANYNDGRAEDDKIRWYGQYICRPQSQVPSGMYELMARSGAINLVIGSESGSNEVLKAMKKMMTIQDLYDELDQFEKYGIQCHLLIFTGFYNETWERYEETLDFIAKCQHWVASGVITKISIGPPYYISKKAPLYVHAEELGIKLDPLDDSDWVQVDDPTNDYAGRAYRRLITELLTAKLGITSSAGAALNLYQILTKMAKMEEELQEKLIDLQSLKQLESSFDGTPA
jgi:hypothetical protein